MFYKFNRNTKTVTQCEDFSEIGSDDTALETQPLIIHMDYSTGIEVVTKFIANDLGYPNGEVFITSSRRDPYKSGSIYSRTYEEALKNHSSMIGDLSKKMNVPVRNFIQVKR